MSYSEGSRSQYARPALTDATRRVNNSQYDQALAAKEHTFNIPHHESLKPEGQLPQPKSLPLSPVSQHDDIRQDGYNNRTGSPVSNAAHARLSAISKESQAHNSNRNSQISTTSTNASDGRRRKTHIGPWQLGKTLGKGATARVRLARHAVTGQPAAIKIVQKKNAQLSQAGSLADLDRRDAELPHVEDGFRRMPYGIEREVAIMKLIDHPHIMRLYDIWENRTEIYLVLEYVDDGELFEHISSSGRLEEEEAVKYFRQMLSAIGYCHSFNICHRDLKPENILLNKEGNVKIADFGMAAIQQNPTHRLQTACGSPHYAAPEVIRARPYKGHKVDIWSMGIILYAALSGYLPFDDDNLPGLLASVKRGRYQMPQDISSEAQDLIHNMLQVDPAHRISIDRIWRHPLIKKYDYLDEFSGGKNASLPDSRLCARPVLRRSEIDRELLRHLRSMWHTLEESQIVKLLLNDEPNEQKLFYTLLLRHREIQLENYVPDLGYSTSDYHHGRPLAQVQKLSTRQFTQPKSNGHGRHISRFTVISNTSDYHPTRKNSGYAETEAAETVQSYDPFRASRSQDLMASVKSLQANVIVHHGRGNLQESDAVPTARSMDTKVPPRPSNASVRSSQTNRARKQILAPPRSFVSRSSLASSNRSRSSTPHVRVSIANKRGVSFSHLNKNTSSSQQKHVKPQAPKATTNRHSKYTEVTDDGGDVLRAVSSPPVSQRYIRSRKATASSSQPQLSARKDGGVSRFWQEDVRQLSTSLAKDCDEAFNRTNVRASRQAYAAIYDDSGSALELPTSSYSTSGSPRTSSPVDPAHVSLPDSRDPSNRASFQTRPLPAPPVRSESTRKELEEARLQAEKRKLSGNGDDSPGYLDRMVNHIDRLLQPGSSPLQRKSDRRATSAPEPLKSIAHDNPRALASIKEGPSEEGFTGRLSDFETFMETERMKAVSHRYTSAPEPGASRSGPRPRNEVDDRQQGRVLRHKESIRVVAPTTPSPAKPPAPLNIRKTSSKGPGQLAAPKISVAHTSSTTSHRNSGVTSTSDGTTKSALSNDHRQYGNRRQPDVKLAHDTTNTVVRKKSSWFKRSYSKTADDTLRSHSSSNDTVRPVDTVLPILDNKKMSFGLARMFKKRSHGVSGDMIIPEFDIHNDEDSLISPKQRQPRNSRTVQEKSRQIEPQRNWLARLFHVKPAQRFLCFTASKSRARRELAGLLKEWRKYGVRDIVVDRPRSIVFGRVAAKNYLTMKEVSFACEIMTVIEHGKKYPLSIVRFTQEKGAASSFYKVVETLETVLKSRGMLVSDDRKKRMMIKTLQSAS